MAKSAIPNRKKTAPINTVSCKLSSGRRPDNIDSSMLSEFFTVDSLTQDQDIAKRLWGLSEELTGQAFTPEGGV